MNKQIHLLCMCQVHVPNKNIVLRMGLKHTYYVYLVYAHILSEHGESLKRLMPFYSSLYFLPLAADDIHKF